MSDTFVIQTTEVERIVVRDIPAPGPVGPKGDKGDTGDPWSNIDGGHADSVYSGLPAIDAGGV